MPSSDLVLSPLEPSTLGVVLRLFPIWHLPGLAWRASRRARLNFALPDNALHVAELHVAPDRRGHGIGEQLLTHADSLARAGGLSKLVLSVLSRNPARRLYTRSGYVAVSERQLAGYEKMCGSPGRVLMEKRLSPIGTKNR